MSKGGKPLRQTEIHVKVVTDNKPLQRINKQVDDTVKRAKGAIKGTDQMTKSFKIMNRNVSGTSKQVQAMNKNLGSASKTANGASKQVQAVSKAANSASKAFKNATTQVSKANVGIMKSIKTTQGMTKAVNASQSAVQNNNKAVKTMTNNLQASNKQMANTSKGASGLNTNMRRMTGTTINATRSMRMGSDQLRTMVSRFNSTKKSSADVSRQMSMMGRETSKTLTTAAERSGFLTQKFNSTRSALVRGLNTIGTEARRNVTGMTNAIGTIPTRFNSARTSLVNGFSTIGTASRRVVSNMTNAFGTLPTNFSGVATRISSAVSSSIIAPFNSAIGVVKNFGATLGLLSTGALVNSGLDRLSSIENAKVSLEVMMGGEKEAQGFMDDILAFAKTTPFAFDKLAETSRNLYAFGMEEDKVVPVMKAIGDAAAASGKGAAGLDQVASAFGDMQVSGTLSMDQINRLSGAGVPALKILANQSGKSVDEMKKQISSGSMSSVKAIDDLVKGMQKGSDGAAGKTAAMAGIMEKMKDTWTGSLDSMKSSVRSTMATLMTPLKPHLQTAMGLFGSTFSKLPDLFASIGQMAKPAMEPLKSIFSDVVSFGQNSLIPFIRATADSFGPLAKVVGTTLIGAFMGFVKVLKDVIGPVLEFLTSTQQYAPVIAGVAAAIGTAVIAYTALNAIKLKFNAIVTTSTLLTEAQRLKLLNLAKTGKGVRAAFLGMAMASKAFMVSLLANPIFLVTAAIVGLGVAFYTAYKRSETFRNIVNNAFASIKTAAMPVIEKLVEHFKMLIGIYKQVYDSAKQYLGNVANFIKTLFTGDWDNVGQAFIKIFADAWSSLKDIASSYIGGIKSVWGDQIQVVKDFILGKLTDWNLMPLVERLSAPFVLAVDKIKSVFTTVKTFIDGFFAAGQGDVMGGVTLLSSILPPDGVAKVFDFFRNFENGITKVKDAINFVKTFVVGFFKVLSGDVDGATVDLSSILPLNQVSKVFKFAGQVISLFNQIKENVINALKGAGAFAKSILTQIAVFWEQNGTQIIDSAKNIFSLIVSILKTVGIIVGAVLVVLFKLAQKYLPPILKIGLKIFMGIWKVVQFVFPIVLWLIKDIFNSVMGVIRGALTFILGAVKFFSSLFTGDWKGMWDGIVQMLKGALTFAWHFINLTFVGKILKGIKAFAVLGKNVFFGLWNSIKTFFVSGATFVRNKVVDFVAAIVKRYQSLRTGVINSVLSLWNYAKAYFTFGIAFIRAKVYQFVVNLIKRWNNLKTNVVNAVLGMWNLARAYFTFGVAFIRTKVYQFVVNLIRRWNNLKTSVSNTVLGLWNFVRTKFSEGVTKAVSLVVGMRTGLVKQWNTLKTRVTALAKGLWEAVKKRFDDMVEGGKALPGRIGDAVKSMAHKALEGVKSLGTTLLNGVANAVNDVIKGINWVLGKLGVTKTLPTWTPGGATVASRPAVGGASAIPAYAQGTDHHPGGPAILGDGGGPELFRTPAGMTGLSPGKDTLMNLPRGTEVLPYEQSKALMNSVPAYSGGTGDGLLSQATSWAVDKTVGAYKAGKNVVNKALDVFDYISSPGKLFNKVLEKFGVQMPSISGAFGSIASGLWGKVKDGALGFLTGQMESAVPASLGKGWPAPYRMTSPFGMRTHPITGARKMHKGVDWAAPSGTPIASQSSGRVNYSGWMGGYGNLIEIGAGPISYRYGHNSKNFAKVGQTVKAGQTIGLVGSTGDSTGPHVHFEIRKNGVPINPMGGGASAARKSANVPPKGVTHAYATGGRVIGDQLAITGENGPEINYLKSGTQVMNHRKSMNLLKSSSLAEQTNYRPESSPTSTTKTITDVQFSPTINVKVESKDGETTESSLRRTIQGVIEDTFDDLRNMYTPEEEY